MQYGAFIYLFFSFAITCLNLNTFCLVFSQVIKAYIDKDNTGDKDNTAFQERYSVTTCAPSNFDKSS